ncbi:MAG TPA: S46 family peptidase [Steroidobacteraceae bacterium]|nr:S46 family peptidase [Steroidobacteraceae bacterium]
MHPPRLFPLLLLLAVGPALADEGMWTFQDFPSRAVKRQYGVEVTPAWLDRVRLATVRLTNCTASFVSPAGLMLTNHHCAAPCLDQHSGAGQSLLDKGFLARAREEELRCAAQIADILVETRSITDQVIAAGRGLGDQAANEARKKALTHLEQQCEQDASQAKQGPLECETVTLYEGGQYWLYKYRRYTDVRLVFAPERDIAAFGGDPDNFQFPRWCLDVAMLRAYDANGKPAQTPDHFDINPAGPDAGQLVFVSGHPGATERLLTVSQLETLRDVDLPDGLLRAAELRGRYIQFGKTSPEARQMVEAPLQTLENVIKVQRVQLDALLDDRLLQQKRQEEATLRARIAAQPALARSVGDPWAEITKAQVVERAISLPYTFLEGGAGFNSRLFNYARLLVRAADERARPNADRLREYRDTALPRLEQRLGAPIPIHPELEKLTLSFSLERMREWLGPDQPLVHELLAHDTPDSLASRLVDGSKLADPAIRLQLWNGGSQAVRDSQDPMIELARRVDPAARAIRKRYEEGVEVPEDSGEQRIGQARFRVYGTTIAPAATFSLRLNFGTVQGWQENGEQIEPFTHLRRLFERDTGEEPFKVPASWLAVKDQLDPDTQFDLATNNDIVGGNSGSPLIAADGRLVGLIFDGNIHSIAGSFWFDPQRNRAIAVHPAIMLQALHTVYKATELLRELGVQ